MAAHIIRGRVSRALTAGIALAIGLAGCGGSSGGGGGKTTTVGAGKPVAVTAREYSFGPDSIEVGAGTVRFELKNGGAQAHDLRVEKDGQDIGGTSIFGPGRTESANVKLSPGTYDFICTVGNHADLGMKGKLTVK
jgi:plastocyanin